MRIDVLVTTDGDRPIANLTAADFELTDNGVAQEVELTTLRDVPVDVIIVLDTSASLGDDGLRHLLGATDTLLGSLRAGDRAALVTFSRAVMMRSALTPTHETVRGMVAGLKAEGTTSVIDATYAATTLQTQADRDRSALLLIFSDGVDTASWLRPEKVLGTVRRSAVVPYAVVVGEAAAMTALAPRRSARRRRSRTTPSTRARASSAIWWWPAAASSCPRRIRVTSNAASPRRSTASASATCSPTRRAASTRLDGIR